MRTPPLPQIVLLLLVCVLAGTLIGAAGTSTASFGAYNPQWDGTSDFREHVDTHAESQLIVDTAAYDTQNATDTVAIILAPTTSYAPNESQRLRSFLQRGGTLLIADDFGQQSNPLLESLGADARFSRLQLRDEQQYYRGPALPIAPNVSETPFTKGVTQLTLNGATAVEPGNATPVVTSSPVAYLDRNATGTFSPGDELGAYPVVTVESVGTGQVIAVSDPSLFINSMVTQPDNQVFVTRLAETHDRVLLDYSKATPLPPIARGLLLLRSSAPLQVGAGLTTLGVWLLIRWRSQRTRSVPAVAERLLPATVLAGLPLWLRDSGGDRHSVDLDEATLRTAVRQQYPTLDPTQLQQVITAVLSERQRDEEDE